VWSIRRRVLLSVKAKKLLASLTQTIFKSYTCSCIIHRVTRLDIKLHRLRQDNGFLSEYTATGCPVTYIQKFWRAEMRASNSCLQVEYLRSVGASTRDAVDTTKSHFRVRTEFIPSSLSSVAHNVGGLRECCGQNFPAASGALPVSDRTVPTCFPVLAMGGAALRNLSN
jgi:hypothetical protein